ncbi:MFS transporter [Edaphobacter dinghuensis]|uniref:MFS transporter n=1 Tax=Edaphobacter dinghuensis TaxID=1560005 RepID=A0A917M026_9BACT|nr:MFS transporter [Edaphobacter dinghuensis]GGG69028.1 MFS transporter [Edaphobacter dinghuensis]
MNQTSAEEVTANLRRRWLLLLPAVFVTYSLAYLDRANYGFGAAAGLAATLHITDSQTALLGSLFFLGYFFFQVPGIAYARRRNTSRLIFFTLIVWGALAALTGVIRSFWLLAVDRLLLGVAESLIFPAMLLLLTNWFTRSERSRANAILILGNPATILWMSAITGFLIRLFGWQMTFILEGAPSIVWAFVWIMIVRDRPEKASWMSTEASALLNSQLAAEQASLPKMGSLGRVLIRPDVLLLSAQYFCWSIGVYGFVLWLPTIIRQGSSLGIGITGLLSAIPYLFAVLAMLLVAYLSDKSLRRQSLVWPFLIFAGTALLGSFLFAAHSFWLAYGCLIIAGGAMFAPYGPFFAILPEIVPSNVCGEAMALVNSFGALGAFFGSWIVGLLQSRTGNSRAGYLLMAIALIVSGFIMILGFRKSVPASRDQPDEVSLDAEIVAPRIP